MRVVRNADNNPHTATAQTAMTTNLNNLLGVHDDMSNDDYHAAPGWSSSHIKTFASGEAEFYDEYIDPPKPLIEEEEPTAAEKWTEDTKGGLILGSAIHLAILQPDLVKREVLEMPPLDLRTNNGKAERDAILEENPGKLILTAKDYQMMLRCRDEVWKHPQAKLLLTGAVCERAYFAIDPETGELVKAKPDAENDLYEVVIDVKSTKKAAHTQFQRDIENLHYWVQPPWYIDAISLVRGSAYAPRHWAWIAVEKRPRPIVEVYFHDPADVAADREDVRGYFIDMLRAKNSGEWRRSKTHGMVAPIGRPSWVKGSRREAN